MDVFLVKQQLAMRKICSLHLCVCSLSPCKTSAGGAPAAVSALTPQTSRSSHRRAASLESLQAVLGLPDQTITENISNSPKARRLLGIHGEDSR